MKCFVFFFRSAGDQLESIEIRSSKLTFLIEQVQIEITSISISKFLLRIP